MDAKKILNRTYKMIKPVANYAGKQFKSSTVMNDNNQQQYNTERSKHAETVIRSHVVWSMGMAVIPLPLADIFAVGAAQLDMIRQLCKIYNTEFSESAGKAIATSLSSSILARLGAASLVKIIPGLGTVIGAVSGSVLAGASTYALGEVFKTHFDTGGTILDFDTERFKRYYQEKFEKGKKVAQELKKKEEMKEQVEKQEKVKQTVKVEVQPKVKTATFESEISEENPKPHAAPSSKFEKASSNLVTTDGQTVIEKLKELAALKDAGVLTEEEFSMMKKKVIAQM